MIENKLQLTVTYEENGDLKKKNYTSAITVDADDPSLIEATNALALILGVDIKGFYISKTALGAPTD